MKEVAWFVLERDGSRDHPTPKEARSHVAELRRLAVELFGALNSDKTNIVSSIVDTSRQAGDDPSVSDVLWQLRRFIPSLAKAEKAIPAGRRQLPTHALVRRLAAIVPDRRALETLVEIALGDVGAAPADVRKLVSDAFGRRRTDNSGLPRTRNVRKKVVRRRSA